jgi:thymidine kinase
MDLTLILGPMKSGKSFDLISCFAPLQYATIPFAVYLSAKHVRDETVWSRNGITIEAQKIKSLNQLLDRPVAVVGVDEVHMFPPHEIAVLEILLKHGTRVVVSGLDMDYRGKLFGTTRRLMELGPGEVRYKRAVCEVCRQPDALYTQVFRGEEPVVSGVPSVIPEDGTYRYVPVCRKCFVHS